ncbi:hypothetical protein OH492_17845 [Vibrio chagasii]|nr:hypothetical protein [Vibrio chagasii]
MLQFATDIEDDDMTAIIGAAGDETTVTGTVLDAETSNPVSGAVVALTDSAGHSYTTVTMTQETLLGDWRCRRPRP